jgi:flagellar biosynthesis/type III secretory pathway ATPase
LVKDALQMSFGTRVVVARGQGLGIFSGFGVGKSVRLAMLASRPMLP